MPWLPATCLVLSAALAVSCTRRYWRRRRTSELVWAGTFAAFGLAAGCETAGSVFGWTETLARTYYLTGATLSVGYLAVGTIYLLTPAPIARAALLVVLVQSTAGALLVWRAPIDTALLATEGWAALQRRGDLVALAITVNALGTLVVVGGALGSAWLLWRGRAAARAASGIALIGVGTIVVALGGSLTRLGQRDLLYAAMAPGLLLIFVGYHLAASRGTGGRTTVAAAVAG
ncbi:MAG: hypothetical protein U0821_18890 [Chloroflexota bacterium]